MSEDVTPQFKHTCDKCVFLGPYKYGDIEYDLYYCDCEKDSHGHELLTARHGDAVTDYTGVTLKQLEGKTYGYGMAIWQARRQARMRGLIP